MATWGAYFTSYVKKTSDPKQIELEEVSEKDLLSKSSSAPKRIDSISSQKSSSSAKKLYDITAEPIFQPLQRSNSNAARVAKMFGYGTPAPVTEENVEDVVQPVAPLAKWTKIESESMQPVASLAVRSKFENKATPVLVPKPTKRAESKMLPPLPPKPKSKQDIFAMLDDFANMADNPKAIQILPDLPEEKPVVAEIRVEKVVAPEEAKEDPAPIRKDSFRGQISPLLSRPKLVVSENPPSEPSDDFRARMLEFERQAEEMRLEKQRRDEEREQILKYERMSEQFRFERESMEIERARMLEEQMRFQAEADRIAEEERQMEQFMKDFQMEMERDRDNEARKLRATQEADLQRQKAIEAEKEAANQAQREREMAIETEERRLKEQADTERQLKEYEARRAQRQRDAEDKERRARVLDERLAQEEADRLTAKLREAEEAERLRNEYTAELEADRRRFQEEEAELERQRIRDERIVTQRRVAKERAERAQFKEDESRRRAQETADRRFSAERRLDLEQESDSDGDRPLTKEEELKKAEEKIRQAFAGLAKERGQEAPPVQRSNTVAIQMPRPVQPVKNYARGINPARRESRIYKGGPDGQRSDRVVSRYNTVAGRPQLSEKPGVLRRPPRNQSGSVGSIGLPGGPRAGIPAAPMRNRPVQRF